MVACIPSLPLAATSRSKVQIMKLIKFYSATIHAGLVESILNLHFILADPLLFCHHHYFVGVPNMPRKSQLQNSGKPTSNSFKYF